MADLSIGKKCNGCCIVLVPKKNITRVSKNQKNRRRLIEIGESQQTLNITASILGLDFGIFEHEFADSHRFTGVESFALCNSCYVKEKSLSS